MYDVIIIGAGIGGLVCGCYLAKAGRKVLIAEHHFKPGGYCTSFKRKGFTFDAAAHCFGGYREGGMTKKVFKDLGIDRLIPIERFDPSDSVMLHNHTISFWADVDKTISGIAAVFPEEKANISDFFTFLLKPDPNAFSKIRTWSFKKLLDRYFTSEKLKAMLSAPLLGNGGLPPSLMSAFVGAKIFSEYLLDGGYYPSDGMQALPDALAARFKELGGELRLSSLVKRIKTKDGQVSGVVLEGDGFMPSRYVVSNCDARQTFMKLLGKRHIPENFYGEIKQMIPSVSVFVLYLGINGHFGSLPTPATNIWVLPHYNLDRIYASLGRNWKADSGGYLIRVSKDCSTILALMLAPYKNRRYWFAHKKTVAEAFIRRVEKEIIPHLSEHIVHKEAATPYTLFRYTFNQKGAAYGWACTPQQLAIPDFRKPSFIKGLYLTGHWTTRGIGISGVAYVGYDTASSLMKKLQTRV
jgi:phytoene dehydrogenase-like protein